MFVKITAKLFAAALFAGCLAITSASGQSSWTYAETWMDDETGFDELNAENSRLYIMGGGVAEIETSSLPHSANMEVELMSPQGRADYGIGMWSQQSSGTSITVVVPLEFVWEPADIGYYVTSTRVQVTCPLEPGMSYGSSSLPIGVTYIGMQLVLPPNLNAAGYLYEKVQPCEVYCNAPLYNRTPPPVSACIQLQIPFGPLGCSVLVRVVKNVQACICFDVGWN